MKDGDVSTCGGHLRKTGDEYAVLALGVYKTE